MRLEDGHLAVNFDCKRGSEILDIHGFMHLTNLRFFRSPAQMYWAKTMIGMYINILYSLTMYIRNSFGVLVVHTHFIYLHGAWNNQIRRPRQAISFVPDVTTTKPLSQAPLLAWPPTIHGTCDPMV
jgi:hypothetical protein